MFDEFFCSDNAGDETDCFMPSQVFTAPVGWLEKTLEPKQAVVQVQCDTGKQQVGGSMHETCVETMTPCVEDVLLQPCGDDESLTDNIWANDSDFETTTNDEGGDKLQWTETDEFLFRAFGPATSIQGDDASHTNNRVVAQATTLARPTVSTGGTRVQTKRERRVGAKVKKKGRHTRCRMCGHPYAKGQDMYIYHLGLPFNGKAHTVCKTPEVLRAPRFPWLKGRMPNKLSARTAAVHTTVCITPEALRAPRFPCFEGWMPNKL